MREAARERQLAGVRDDLPKLIYEGPECPKETLDVRAESAGTNRTYINFADRLVDEEPELAAEVQHYINADVTVLSHRAGFVCRASDAPAVGNSMGREMILGSPSRRCLANPVSSPATG